MSTSKHALLVVALLALGFANPAAAQFGEPPTFPEPGAGQDWLEEAAAAIIPTQKVLTGMRVTDHVSGRLLDDIYYDEVPVDDIDSLDPAANDDGIWPDLVANDGTYSNFSESNEFLGPESNGIKQRLIRMIESAEELDPLEFFMIPVASVDSYSPSDYLVEEEQKQKMPSYLEQEEARDSKILEWNSLFLRDYRIDPKSPISEFWPLYVPRPPQMPRSEPPEGFSAAFLDTLEAAEGQEAEGGTTTPRPSGLTNYSSNQVNYGAGGSGGPPPGYQQY
ncbi:hypothetical protein ACFL34_02450 [Candidatus Sumerlaeota bacterium]